jgi:hypothetical protein
LPSSEVVESDNHENLANRQSLSGISLECILHAKHFDVELLPPPNSQSQVFEAIGTSTQNKCEGEPKMSCFG